MASLGACSSPVRMSEPRIDSSCCSSPAQESDSERYVSGEKSGFFSKLLVLLSQKVAGDRRTDSDNRRDSGISRWRLIWIFEQLATVNRGFRLMSRGL